jgi:protein-glutamine gamma-glutamyltransferase
MFLAGAALVLWGWQSGLLAVAIVLAAMLELSRWVAWRWDAGEADLNRAWDFTSVLFIAAAVYLYGAEDVTQSALTLVQWLPMIFFPMMAAQAYGTKDQIKLRTFSWILRDKQGEWLDREINISHIYFAVCLLSASITNRHSPLFYIGFVALASVALWHGRPQRFSRLACSVLVLGVGVTGYLAHQKMQEAQSFLDAAIGRALGIIPRRNPDAGASHTAIGQLGMLKLSGRIMWRIQSDDPPPGLLREAAYTIFRKTSWYSSKQEFAQVAQDLDDTWIFLDDLKPDSQVTIAGYMRPRGELLPLPYATVKISRLPVYELQKTTLGAVRASGGPRFVQFNAAFIPRAYIDAEPSEDDLQIPESERQTLDRIVGELGLESLSLDQKLAVIDAWFQKNFSYAAYLWRERGNSEETRSPLERFLNETRAGHCEYFATAAVLLLRAAGEHARYATGYAVVEKGSQKNTFVLRERHAHAWALVYKDGTWRDFDTTPPAWNLIESQNAPDWELFSDALSAMRFYFSRLISNKENHRHYLMWSLAPLFAILIWRFTWIKFRAGDPRNQAHWIAGRHWPGQDSEFYALVRKVGDAAAPPLPGETLGGWLERLDRAGVVSKRDLGPLLQLHYRYRFDPAGINSSERQQLREQVAEFTRNGKSHEQKPGY